MNTIKILSLALALSLIFSFGFVSTKAHLENVEVMESKVYCYELGGSWNYEFGECKLSMYDDLEEE